MPYVIAAIILAALLLLWLAAVYGKRRKFGFYGLSEYHYAHRGLHDIDRDIPENSLAAFRLAVENGYGAELDVHLTKDGRLAVMHDDTLLRMTGNPRRISDCTLAELSELRLAGTQERIPLLEEVLPLFEGRTPLVIEIKPCGKNYAVLTRKVCNLLRSYPHLSFCIESFDPRVLLWLRRKHPELIRGQLSCDFLKDRHGLSLPAAFCLTALLTNFLTAPHFVAYRFEDRRQPSVLLCRKLWGVQGFNWTIRTAEDAEQSLKEGNLIIFEHCRPE